MKHYTIKDANAEKEKISARLSMATYIVVAAITAALFFWGSR